LAGGIGGAIGRLRTDDNRRLGGFDLYEQQVRQRFQLLVNERFADCKSVSRIRSSA
jgi:hypothetical protein